MSQGEGGGRPKLWSSVDEMEAAMEGYFARWKDLDTEDPQSKKTPNVFGLCLHAGMSYDTFCDIVNGTYDEIDEKFCHAAKRAKLRILEYNAERSLSHTAGVVFNTVNLTRKMKEPWKNAQVNEVTGEGGGALVIQITPNQASIT